MLEKQLEKERKWCINCNNPFDPNGANDKDKNYCNGCNIL